MFSILFLVLPAPLTCLTGYKFEDNKSDKRYDTENGEMIYELPVFPSNLATCFSLYINYNRYSSLVPIMDFRTGYEEDYTEFLYGGSNKKIMSAS